MASLTDSAFEQDICAICLDPLSSAAVSTLPCKHAFHESCVDEMRAVGCNNVCPMCRADLPPGPEQLFEDAARRYVVLKRDVTHGGSWGAGWASFERTTEHEKEADAILGLWKVAAKQGHAKAHCGLGVFLKVRGDVAGAQGSYEAALASDPTLARAHSNLGLLKRDNKDLDGAEESFRESLVHCPDDADANSNLGAILHAKGDLTGAEGCYQTAIKADKKHAKAHNNLATLLMAKGDKKSAELLFRKAIKLDESYADAHYGLGTVLHSMGKPSTAEASLRKALSLVGPSNSRCHAAALARLAIVLVTKGDSQGAVDNFRASLAIDPNNSIAQGHLGVLLHTKAAAAVAAAAKNKITDNSTSSSTAAAAAAAAAEKTSTKVVSNHKSGGSGCKENLRAEQPSDTDESDSPDMWKEAEACYRAALAQNPQMSNIHSNLGALLRAQGNLEDAAEAFRNALAVDSSHAKAAEGLAAVEADSLKEQGGLN